MSMTAFAIVVTVLVAGSAILYAIGEIRSLISRRKRAPAAQAFVSMRVSAGEHQAEVSQGIYAVGSPEHNAQVEVMLRQVNEQLAPQGKRVPERVAMDIIGQEESEF